MLLFGDAAEADLLVDAARSDQDALGPQRHLAIAFFACGVDALLDQRAADAEATRLLLDQQEPQLGDFVAALDQEDRADRLSAGFRDPAVLARSIIISDE